MGPSFRLTNMSPVRFLLSLSLYSSTGVIVKKNNKKKQLENEQIHLLGTLINVKYRQDCFTWFSRQVLEVHRLADLAIRGPTELHLHSNGLGEVSVTVRWRAEHDGHLSVDISLGEGALTLPGVLEETHLNVLCGGGTGNGKC